VDDRIRISIEMRQPSQLGEAAGQIVVAQGNAAIASAINRCPFDLQISSTFQWTLN